MKRALLIAAAIMFLALPAYASAPYAALFGDTLGGPGGANHSIYGIDYIPAPYTFIEMWVWFLPDLSKGMVMAEFMIAYPTPTYIIQSTVTSNPLIQYEVGTLPAGVSVSFESVNCQYDWTWTHHQEIIVKTLTASTIRIVGHPGNGGHIYVATCEPGYPVDDCTIRNYLSLNQEGLLGTQRATWGSIKSLF